jgi:hypothetical protein
VRRWRAPEQPDVELREAIAPAPQSAVDLGSLEALAEQEVPEPLHRRVTWPVLGAREARVGELVSPGLAHALDEHVQVEPVGRQEERAVDVEEDERQTATVASSADRSDAT